MTRSTWLTGLLSIGFAATLAQADDPPTYERDVRPVLRKHCTICHNARKAEALETSGGLVLDSFDAIQKGLKDRPIAKAGHARESPLFLRLIEQDEEKRMPKDADPVDEADRLVLQRWLDAGMVRGEAKKSVAPTRPRRVVRTLDVSIPVDLKLDNKPVKVLLKVGPLPAVTALVFRPNSHWLAAGTVGQAIVWDLDEGEPALVLGDLPGSVHALAFRPDGQALAIGGGLAARSAFVRLYRLDGQLLAEMYGHEDVVSGLAFAPDGQRLASASLDGTVRIWETTSGKEVAVSKGHSDFVNEIVFAADGLSVFTASKDRSIKRFDAQTGKGLRTYSDHNDDVLALAIRPDGSEFVSAGNEPQLRFWKVDGDKPSKRQGGHGGPVHQLAFTADGRRLVSAGADGTIRIWDGRSGGLEKTLAGAVDWQYAAAISSEGKFAAGAGWDGLVRVWDVAGGKLIAVLLQPLPIEWSDPAWLVVAPVGVLSTSDALKGLLRRRVGDSEDDAGPLVDPERLRKALRGEPIESE